MPNRPTLPTAHPTAPLKPACQPLPAHLPLPLRAAPPQNLPARRRPLGHQTGPARAELAKQPAIRCRPARKAAAGLLRTAPLSSPPSRLVPPPLPGPHPIPASPSCGCRWVARSGALKLMRSLVAAPPSGSAPSELWSRCANHSCCAATEPCVAAAAPGPPIVRVCATKALLCWAQNVLDPQPACSWLQGAARGRRRPQAAGLVHVT